MKTADLLRQALVLNLKRWRSIERLTQLEASERLDIGRTVIAQDYSGSKLETLLDLWDRVGGSVAFDVVGPRAKPDEAATRVAAPPP